MHCTPCLTDWTAGHLRHADLFDDLIEAEGYSKGSIAHYKSDALAVWNALLSVYLGPTDLNDELMGQLVRPIVDAAPAKDKKHSACESPINLAPHGIMRKNVRIVEESEPANENAASHRVFVGRTDNGPAGIRQFTVAFVQDGARYLNLGSGQEQSGVFDDPSLHDYVC